MEYCGEAYLLDCNGLYQRIGKLQKQHTETFDIPYVQSIKYRNAKLDPNQFCTLMNSRTFAECDRVKVDYDNALGKIKISIRHDIIVAFSESLSDYMGFISCNFSFGDYYADLQYFENSEHESFVNRTTIYSVTKSDGDMKRQDTVNHSNPTIILELLHKDKCESCEEEDENCICHLLDYEKED